jgi:hypothetical protein
LYTRYHTALIWNCHALSPTLYLTPHKHKNKHTHTPPIRRLLPNTRHFEASLPTERTYAAPLLLQGKGKRSYKLRHTRPDYTVSRQHDRQTDLHIRRHTTSTITHLHVVAPAYTFVTIQHGRHTNNMAAERHTTFAITNIHGNTLAHTSRYNMAATRHAAFPITTIHGITSYTYVTIQHGRHTKQQRGRRALPYIHNYQYTRHHPLHIRQNTTWPTHQTTTWPPSVTLHSQLPIYTASPLAHTSQYNMASERHAVPPAHARCIYICAMKSQFALTSAI